jgi:hypothetical protein
MATAAPARHVPLMVLYALALTLKLLCAMTYVGAVAAAFTTTSPEVRARAVHRFASPALLATWLLGGALAWLRGTRLIEPWIVSGFGLSVLSLLSLVYHAARAPRSRSGLSVCLAPIALTVALMVSRPGGASRAAAGSSPAHAAAASVEASP